MKLKTIISGFTNLVFKKESIEIIAKERKAICDKCIISNYGKSRLCKKTLGGCGCVLSAKRRVVDDELEYCPISKWDGVNVDQRYYDWSIKSGILEKGFVSVSCEHEKEASFSVAAQFNEGLCDGHVKTINQCVKAAKIKIDSIHSHSNKMP